MLTMRVRLPRLSWLCAPNNGYAYHDFSQLYFAHRKMLLPAVAPVKSTAFSCSGCIQVISNIHKLSHPRPCLHAHLPSCQPHHIFSGNPELIYAIFRRLYHVVSSNYYSPSSTPGRASSQYHIKLLRPAYHAHQSRG